MLSSGPMTPARPGVPSRVIQGFFPGGQPRILQPTVTSGSPTIGLPPPVAPVQPRMDAVQPVIAPARPNPIPPASRPGFPAPKAEPKLSNAQRPGTVQPFNASRPTIAQPIRPDGARPAGVQPFTVAKPRLPQPVSPQHPAPTAIQPHADNAFALPANFSFKPRGSGVPLPETVQKKFESFFNTSFADVRVHVGHEASSIGALAFTHGSDLYFAPGQYNPQSTQGQQLLGHELTHVVQQRAGRVRNPLGVGVAVVQDPALEAEAERMGLRAASAAEPIQAKLAGDGPNARPVSPPTTVAANGAILPASPSLARQPVQRKSGPVLPSLPAAPRKAVADTPFAARMSANNALSSISVRANPKAGSYSHRPSQIVQRTEKSTGLISELAVPRTFQSPEATAQSEAGDELNRIADGLVMNDNTLTQNQQSDLENLFGVGSVELPIPIPSDAKLIQSAALTETPTASITSYYAYIARNQVLCNKIAKFVMRTMVVARQTEYIREIVQGRDWYKYKFLAEVHYYRVRSTKESFFHKDTLGQTLFVNLHYINDKPIAGPEYIVNPPNVDEHEATIKRSLPDEFLLDLELARKSYLGKPDAIKYSTIPQNGVVAFVDELIHHMTPTSGPRHIASIWLRRLLKGTPEFDKAVSDITARSARSAQNKSSKPWKKLVLRMNISDNERITRADWIKFGLEESEWDRLLRRHEKSGGNTGYNVVSIPNAGGNKPITGPWLTRTMSQTALRNPTEIPEHPTGERRFFRVWVRAVPR
jgi:hypothetical protein